MTAATRSAGAVTGLLVCLGLGLFGQAGWLAALVLGIVAGLLMAGLLGWMIDGGPRAMHASDWAPPPVPLATLVPLATPVPESHLADAGAAETGADAETACQGPHVGGPQQAVLRVLLVWSGQRRPSLREQLGHWPQPACDCSFWAIAICWARLFSCG